LPWIARKKLPSEAKQEAKKKKRKGGNTRNRKANGKFAAAQKTGGSCSVYLSNTQTT